ncbi:mandelate racemase [Variovorax sp. LjRoot290]|uniref:enolase C-terminal domain-like protein n=1 Tax=Variovorax sp. LjRoot290 TaxID=3342316 RepID=UPI003ECF28FE
MKITSFQVRCAIVPMPEPLRTASGTVGVSPLVLLTINTDAGVQGHSILFSYGLAAQKPLAELMRNLESVAVGQPLAPADLSSRLHGHFRMLGTEGLVGMALAGIDMAVWDAFARAHELPLSAMLGSSPRPVQAYAGVSYEGVLGSGQSAEKWARKGFKAVKAKIGYPTVAEDLAVVRAMRSAMGPDAAIMVDYNQSLSTSDAARRLRALEGEGLAWIEEPIVAHDYAGLVQLAAATTTPLQSGENWLGALGFRHAFDAGVRGLAMPDAMRCGGVTGWQQIAALGQLYGVALSNHFWPEVSAHLLCATPTAHWLEYMDWWNPILKEPLDVRDGMAYTSERPGSGMEFNEEAVQRYLV